MRPTGVVPSDSAVLVITFVPSSQTSTTLEVPLISTCTSSSCQVRVEMGGPEVETPVTALAYESLPLLRRKIETSEPLAAVLKRTIETFVLPWLTTWKRPS